MGEGDEGRNGEGGNVPSFRKGERGGMQILNAGALLAYPDEGWS